MMPTRGAMVLVAGAADCSGVFSSGGLSSMAVSGCASEAEVWVSTVLVVRQQLNMDSRVSSEQV